MLRLFVALPVPAMLRERLAGVQHAWAAAGHQFRWARVGGLHLTLVFLGQRDVADVPTLEAAMRQAATGRRPLRLAVRSLGGFPTLTRPRTLWAGVGGDLAGLHELHRALQRELQGAGITFQPQPFRPHITLGRARGTPAPVDVVRLGDEATTTFGAFTATAVDLVRSELGPGGSIYTTIHRSPLRDARAAPAAGDDPPPGTGEPPGRRRVLAPGSTATEVRP